MDINYFPRDLVFSFGDRMKKTAPLLLYNILKVAHTQRTLAKSIEKPEERWFWVNWTAEKPLKDWNFLRDLVYFWRTYAVTNNFKRF